MRETVPAAEPGTACQGIAGDPHRIEVWTIRIPEARNVPGLGASLSAEERRRASRQVRPRDRSDFVACRGTLRRILGSRLDRPPEVLEFRNGPGGKPALADPGDPPLRFNLSHSGDLLLIAASTGPGVGIDVERVRHDRDHDAVAEHFFSQRELEALAALPPHRKVAAFHGCWTRKEAYVKGRGDGFGLSPHLFSVSCPPSPPALLDVEGEAGEPARWTLLDIDPGPGYSATLAVAGRDIRTADRRWPST